MLSLSSNERSIRAPDFLVSITAQQWRNSIPLIQSSRRERGIQFMKIIFRRNSMNGKRKFEMFFLPRAPFVAERENVRKSNLFFREKGKLDLNIFRDGKPWQSEKESFEYFGLSCN